MNFRSLIEILPQLLLYIAIAPGVVGMLRWFKSRFQGRQGPSPVQPYRDVWKLFHRRAVIPETTSWVFLAAPIIMFGCYVLIGAMVPVIFLPTHNQIFQQEYGPPMADFLVIVGLISLARFVLALAGMDTGTPYGGMGSSREMFLQILTEPVLVIVAYILALNWNTTSLSGVMSVQADTGKIIAGSQTAGGLLPAVFAPLLNIINPLFILTFIALVLVMLAEAGRIPFDNPATHLELAMTGKAIQLEYGGHNLAFIEWAEAMRLTFFLTLLWNLFFPGWLASLDKSLMHNLGLILLYPLKLLVSVIALAFWEANHARRRLRGAVTPGGLALALSIFAIFLVYVLHYFAF